MKALFVDCCISQRGAASRTAALCRAYLESWQSAHPESTVETVRLSELDLPPLNVERIDRRDELFRQKAFDHPVFDLARQFAAADHIVVGAPFWDMNFPALLRIYIEHISANGISYCYGPDGPRGLCAASKLVYLTTGGDYELPESNGVAYWRQLCGMYGIDAFDYVFAGGLDAAPERAAERMAEACQKAAALAKA